MFCFLQIHLKYKIKDEKSRKIINTITTTLHYFSYVHCRSQVVKFEAHSKIWEWKLLTNAPLIYSSEQLSADDLFCKWCTLIPDIPIHTWKGAKPYIQNKPKMAWHEKKLLENRRYLHLQHRICTSKMKIIFKNKNLWIRSRWNIKQG